ncbi:histidine kinase N-terminal 7TM domain-containing protein [Halorientalis halophila]|uniref:histidine kinase N-terminal 7TM domain-containing protein n=1 Tax=Halorientalis halophila TaxID=3108499 RepID=UPI0030080138
MSTHELAYQAVLAVSGLLCVGVASYAWRRRERRGAKPLVGLFFAVLFWIATTALVIAAAGTPTGAAVARAQYVGVTLSVMFVFLLALEYSGRGEHVTRTTAALLLVEPILANVAVWVPPLRDQFLRFGAVDPGTYYGFAYEFGPLFTVHTIYSYVLLVAAAVMYVSFAVRSEEIYQRQTVGLFVGLVAPWIGNALFVSGAVSVDVTPVGFAITGVALWWAIFYQDFLEVVPVARGTVVDNLDAGVVVVDRTDRIVGVNPRGRELLGETEPLIGRPVTEGLAEFPTLREAFEDLSGTEGTDEMEVAVGPRDFQVKVSPLANQRDERIGRLLVIEDISERKRRRRELERQNEQLEQFASVVSHDLRNPLSVASSRLELGVETGDRQHFERVERAHARMDRIIDDVLTLAREGKGVTETERTSLAAVATAAWNHVATGEATLEVVEDRALLADPARLQRAFENLFRNSVEHGGSDVTVTVGPTDEGFYVADDGPGIPEADRDRIFENGYSNGEDGTGFGLAIVQTIVTAHGWEIEAVESESRGARFEVAGVGSVDERPPVDGTDEREPDPLSRTDADEASADGGRE